MGYIFLYISAAYHSQWSATECLGYVHMFSNNHSFPTIIFYFLFRLGTKRSQIMLMPTPVLPTSITSQHRHSSFLFFYIYVDLIFWSWCCIERILFPSFQVCGRPFFLLCFDWHLHCVCNQAGSWATTTHPVKCTSWTITNGFPVPVGILFSGN